MIDRCTCLDPENVKQTAEALRLGMSGTTAHLASCPFSFKPAPARVDTRRLSGEPVLCACGDAEHEHAPDGERACRRCGCTKLRLLPPVLERLSVVEARLEEVTRVYGVRLDMHVQTYTELEDKLRAVETRAERRRACNIADEAATVRAALKKLYAAENGPVVREAFERLMARLGARE